jgi:hypothetical protein
MKALWKKNRDFGRTKEYKEDMPSMNGTYSGNVLLFIVGLVDADPISIEAPLVVTEESKLSAAIKIPLAALPLKRERLDTQTPAEDVPSHAVLLLNIEFTGKVTFKDAMLQQEGEPVKAISGTGFEVKQVSIFVQNVGTFDLTGGDMPAKINRKTYHGFHSGVPSAEGGEGIIVMLAGMVTGDIFGEKPLPVAIVLNGQRSTVNGQRSTGDKRHCAVEC